MPNWIRKLMANNAIPTVQQTIQPQYRFTIEMDGRNINTHDQLNEITNPADYIQEINTRIGVNWDFPTLPNQTTLSDEERKFLRVMLSKRIVFLNGRGERITIDGNRISEDMIHYLEVMAGQMYDTLNIQFNNTIRDNNHRLNTMANVIQYYVMNLVYIYIYHNL